MSITFEDLRDRYRVQIKESKAAKAIGSHISLYTAAGTAAYLNIALVNSMIGITSTYREGLIHPFTLWETGGAVATFLIYDKREILNDACHTLAEVTMNSYRTVEGSVQTNVAKAKTKAHSVYADVAQAAHTAIEESKVKARAQAHNWYNTATGYAKRVKESIEQKQQDFSIAIHGLDTYTKRPFVREAKKRVVRHQLPDSKPSMYTHTFFVREARKRLGLSPIERIFDQMHRNYL